MLPYSLIGAGDVYNLTERLGLMLRIAVVYVKLTFIMAQKPLRLHKELYLAGSIYHQEDVAVVMLYIAEKCCTVPDDERSGSKRSSSGRQDG